MSTTKFKWHLRSLFALTFSVVCIIALAGTAFASASLVQLSTDPYTNSTSEHQTEVEPDTFSFGSTIVSAFQVGRFTDGGSSNIGFATSTNNGGSWTNGFLPGITRIVNPANPRHWPGWATRRTTEWHGHRPHRQCQWDSRPGLQF